MEIEDSQTTRNLKCTFPEIFSTNLGKLAKSLHNITPCFILHLTETGNELQRLCHTGVRKKAS